MTVLDILFASSTAALEVEPIDYDLFEEELDWWYDRQAEEAYFEALEDRWGEDEAAEKAFQLWLDWLDALDARNARKAGRARRFDLNRCSRVRRRDSLDSEGMSGGWRREREDGSALGRRYRQLAIAELAAWRSGFDPDGFDTDGFDERLIAYGHETSWEEEAVVEYCQRPAVGHPSGFGLTGTTRRERRYEQRERHFAGLMKCRHGVPL